MQLRGFRKRLRLAMVATRTTLRIMKLTAILLLILCLHASAKTFSQEITLSLNNANLETVFKEIRKQTHYKFLYTKEQLGSSQKVSIDVTKAPLEKVLEICFRNQPLTYVLEDKVVIIRFKEKAIETVQGLIQLEDISGRITNEQGEPLEGVTIAIKGTNKATATNDKGEFVLKDAEPNSIIIISSVGFQTQEVRLQGRTTVFIQLKMVINSLDETVVIAYGITTKRLNTGSISKVSGGDISNQPVSNPLAALQGRVPGLVITQGNGLPGSGFSVLIRGRNSIQNGISPLFIIDGIPFLSSDERLTQRSGINANNPFNTLNPEDILSVEILKDADATAIYGSRGANGVILITTKRAKPNENLVEANIYHGWGRQTRTMKFMNTTQYLQMRREAFANDGVIPDASNAPDLLLWDTTRNMNWKNILLSETAKTFNANLRYSGGNDITGFTLGANYNSETTVFPGDFGNKEAGVSLSVSHRPKKIMLSSDFTASYTNQHSKLPLQNLGQYLALPPHAMNLYDSIRNLNWSEGGEYFGNPLALYRQTYTGLTQRFSGNAVLRYKFNQKFNLHVTSGYNSIWFDETSLTPIASQNPSSNPFGAASFGTTSIQNWAVEPQLNYADKLGAKGKLQVLAGASWQGSQTKKSLISGAGYTNDALIESISGAATTIATNSKGQYRYHAIFSRINYNWDNKYLINITARRDGSSRFGPDKRNANYSATGIGWIFTNEKSLSNKTFLSYGKIRGSYGITGNDQISNYQYLDTWVGTRYPYQGVPGYRPSKLFNPNYSWEQIRKIEAAIELGFLKNRILFNLNWFNGKSDNQIINYNLPSQTGFNQILRNFPGVVENKGVEIQIESINMKTKNFEWSSGFNITFPKNKLIAFPGLESSSYAANYIIGKPLNSFIGYHYTGIDLQTGLYTFDDVNKNGQIDFDASDFVYNGTTDPRFYGGFQNSFRYKNIDLDFLFEFKKQLGLDNIKNSSTLIGSLTNLPVQVLNRWQKQNDIAKYQRFSQNFSNPAYETSYFFGLSDAILTNASFIRLKNLNISYTIISKKLQKIGASKCRLYIQARNLFTITNYPGADPENQSLVGLSPMRVIAGGIKLTF